MVPLIVKGFKIEVIISRYYLVVFKFHYMYHFIFGLFAAGSILDTVKVGLSVREKSTASLRICMGFRSLIMAETLDTR